MSKLENVMDDVPSQTTKQRPERALPFERVALVLQGGGALGAYQAGVYQAIHEAGIDVHWISGTSIGAINGALIVGNPPERRVERLLEFWETVTKPSAAFQTMQWFSDLWGNENDQARSWANKMSTLSTMLHGAPNFFSPRPMPPINTTAKRPEDVGYYDNAPLKTTLERLVDFDLINRKTMQLSIGAANVRTGAPVTFDNLDEKIMIEHVMASASLPPGFAPTRVDGEYYWDGAVVSKHTDAMRNRQLTKPQRTGFPSRPLGFERRSAARYTLRLPSRDRDAQREPPQRFARPIPQNAAVQTRCMSVFRQAPH
jgi:NTE family protein